MSIEPAPFSKLPAKPPPRPRGFKTRPIDIERWERDLKCVQMRREEMDWDTIVNALGYADRSHAHRCFNSVMQKYPRDDVEEMRNLELDRIERACRALEPMIAAGGLTAVKAIEAWNKLSERRAKLMGLDKPDRRELTVLSSDTVSQAIDKLNAELNMQARANDVDLSTLIIDAE